MRCMAHIIADCSTTLNVHRTVKAKRTAFGIILESDALGYCMLQRVFTSSRPDSSPH